MKRDGFNFDLVRPCPHCPFRRDREPYLNGPRAEEIANGMERQTFVCHETIHGKQPRNARGQFMARPKSHCAGVLIIMARENKWGDLQQIAMRLGIFDPAALDMQAPTFDTLDQFVQANGGEGVRWFGGRGTSESYRRQRRPHA